MQRLVGRRLPDVELPATSGALVNLARLKGLAVIFCYPWTGRPGHPNPPRWDEIPGAHGSTPQALGYSKLHEEFLRRGVTVFGLSFQDTEWQSEFAARCALAFPLLSDAGERIAAALDLPIFETGGRRYLERLTLIARDGAIAAVRHPVPTPEEDAPECLALCMGIQSELG